MANWTRLVSLTEAPFVALLHDDDRWHRDFLDRRISFMQAHSSCGLVFSPTREIDENGNAVGYLDPGFEEGLHTAETLLPLLVRRNVIGHPVSVIARRAAYETVGMAFNTDFPYADYEMWFRIVLRFPVGYVDVADADYRLHAMSTRVLEPHDRQLELRLLDHLIDLAERERPGVLSRRDRRRPRSDVLLALALDTVVDAQRRRSLRYLLEAIHTYPLSALDPRVGVWLVAIPLGRLGSRMVRSGRSFVRRHPIRRHIRSV